MRFYWKELNFSGNRNGFVVDYWINKKYSSLLINNDNVWVFTSYPYKRRYVQPLTHTHSIIRCQCVVGCERQGKIKRQAFCLFLPLLSLSVYLCLLLSPLYLSRYVCLPLSLRGVCLYLTFLPSVCLPSASLYISNCPVVFLLQLVQSLHSCALKWKCVMSLFPFKLSQRDNVRWDVCKMKKMQEKSFHISDSKYWILETDCICSC